MNNETKLTVVSNEFEACRQYRDQLLVNHASHSDAVKGTVRSNGAVKGAALAFRDELGAVCRLGSDELGDGRESLPCLLLATLQR